MPRNLIQASYNTQGITDLVKNPQDRSTAVRPVIERLGGSIESFDYAFGDYDIVASLGYKVMICGSTIWLVYKQVRQAFEELKQTGRVNPDRFGSRWDVASLLGLDDIYELERKYGVSQIPVA